jgi:trehalose 6-phosphate phosphatase
MLEPEPRLESVRQGDVIGSACREQQDRNENEEGAAHGGGESSRASPGAGRLAGVDDLEVVRARPDRAGLFIDFDGTLSEIVPHPEDALPIEGAVDLLSSLATTYRVVAVVSGRRARGVAQRLGRPAGVRCFGLYGLEDESGPLDPVGAEMLEAVTRLLPELERAVAVVPAARIEPKGFHVSVHYRGADDPVAARRSLLAVLGPAAKRERMRLIEGKRVIEIAPEQAPSKGDLVEGVVRGEHLEALAYAGDDLPDLEAFAAVERLRSEGIAGVRIAVRSVETPEEVVGAADLVVEGPVGLVELLRGLLRTR